MISLLEMKRKNKEAGKHFFDRGNPRVLSKHGNYLVTMTMDRKGYVIYEFDEQSGNVRFVDNPTGDYSHQPYKTKPEAVKYARSLN